MPAAKRKLRPVEPVEPAAPPVPDDRAELAAAIERRKQADAAVAAKVETVARAVAAMGAAELAIEKCRSGIPKAQEADATATASFLDKGKTPAAAWRTSSAISSLARAERDLETAIAARKRLQQNLAELQDDAAAARNAVSIAVERIILPVAQKLCDELRAARIRVVVINRMLGELLDDGQRNAPQFRDLMRGLRANAERDAVLKELRDEIKSLRFANVVDDDGAAMAEAAVWKAVLAELRDRPETELPKV